MKTQIFKYIVFALAAGVILESCKDNVIVPVANNKPVDSLKNLIAALNKTLVTVNKGDGSIMIQKAKYKNSTDSVNALSSSYTNNVQYTVYIMDGGTTVVPCGTCRTSNSGKGDVSKTQGVDGATVVLSSGGNTYTATSADGRAIFNNVAVGGIATVTVTATGYTSVTYTTVMYWGGYVSGITSNVSTSVALYPTTGNNVVKYSGQIYINKSVMDDTLGHLYNASTDTKNYLKFVTTPGAYLGPNHTYYDSYFGGYYWPQSAYAAPPSGSEITFDQATNYGGLNNIFAYPSSLLDFNAPYTSAPGDPITISYNGLSAFATVTATGSYTLSVPSFANDPGVTFDYSTSFQDNYTSLITASSDTVALKATKVVTGFTDKQMHATDWTNYNTTTKSYAVISSVKWYSVTRQAYFYPYMTDGSGSYGSLSGMSLIGTPGQTYTNNIYLFAGYVTAY